MSFWWRLRELGRPVYHSPTFLWVRGRQFLTQPYLGPKYTWEDAAVFIVDTSEIKAISVKYVDTWIVQIMLFNIEKSLN